MGPADLASVASVIFSLCLTYEGRTPLFKARSGNRGKTYRRTNVGADVDLLGPSPGRHLFHPLHLPFDMSGRDANREHESNFKSPRGIFKKTNASRKLISHLISAEYSWY